MGNPFQVSLALANTSATNIAASQSPGAGAITLNGSTVTAGVATLDIARRVSIASGSNDSGITFTVVGTNRTGNALSETVTGASGAAAATTQDFATVSAVSHTGSVAGTVTVGTNGVASSSWLVIDRHNNIVNLGVGVVISGTINWTVEYTYDDPNAPFTSTFPTIFSQTAMASKASNTDAGNTFNFPIFAIRLTQNSFSSGATADMIVIQSGLASGY